MTTTPDRFSLVDPHQIDLATLEVDALVIGTHSTDDGITLAAGSDAVSSRFPQPLTDTFALLNATGGASEVTRITSLGAITAPVLVSVGLGAAEELTADGLRKATASAIRGLAGKGTVAVALPVRDADDLRAVAEGALLGAYRFAGYRRDPKPGTLDPVAAITLVAPDTAGTAELSRAQTVIEAVSRTRDWVNAAPNWLRPPDLAEQMANAAPSSVNVEILDPDALAAQGFGGLLAVGGGSEAGPRLVRLAYRPANPRAHIALVGKGITFDSGGISIKPTQGMWEMKYDMAGAAAVANTVFAAAVLGLEVSVTGYAALAENMVSGASYRPGDVITMYNGKTVEVLNTDAEGRMVLGDALARASEDEPDYLVEISTLTGGQPIALGKRTMGSMGTTELLERLKAAGERTGEPSWPMPLPDDVRKNMDSDLADVQQVATGMDRAGHMLQGGLFLREFIGEGISWAHVDIAGPAYNSGEANGYLAKGGTGVPVRTLLALMEDIAANG